MARSSLVAVGFLALFFHWAAYYTLKHKVEPFMYDYYLFSWWSYILLLEAVLAFRRKKFLILTRRFPSFVVISCAFWCLFELINLRLDNWFYVNIPTPVWIRYPGYLLAYGTVIPGIYLTREVLSEVIKTIPMRRLPAPRSYAGLAIFSGLALFALVLAFPAYLFCLTWIFLALIMDGWNYAKGYHSFMGEFERGEAGGLVTTMLAGLVCGFLWEFWNWGAVSRWIYAVPFFEKTKLFEMPLLGYLGFPVFALETISFVAFMEKGGLLDRHRIPALLIAIVVSISSFPAIDRYTVFSSLTPIEEISFFSAETQKALQAQGVRTIFGIIDPTVLGGKEQNLVRLMTLKGLGYENVFKLTRAGINDVRALAGLTPAQVGAILGEKNMRRTEVYLRAARRAAQLLY